MNVLVTGGAGYIGSILTEELLAAGHRVVVVDDLSQGHADTVVEPASLFVADVRDRDRLVDILRTEHIEAVVHMAARSIVSHSMSDPAEYYATNVGGSLALLDAMRTSGVSRLVFSSTAAVYQGGSSEPLDEDAPVEPANPYGETKLAVERAVVWHARAYGTSAIVLRYFNVAGATERNGERHHPETHLIPRVLEMALPGATGALSIYGADYDTPDGTCVRDYLHVSDLARAHVLALEARLARAEVRTYNLGGNVGRSVREVISVAEAVTSCRLTVATEPRRAGDPARLVASSARIRRELGWFPRQSDLPSIIESAWTFLGRRT